MTNYSKVSKIEHMFKELSNCEGRLIDFDFEEYINGIRKNKRRKEKLFQKKRKRKGLEQAIVKELRSNSSVSRTGEKVVVDSVKGLCSTSPHNKNKGILRKSTKNLKLWL